MRIIAGKFGSRSLVAPKGVGTRPTLDRTRESLFSMLAPYLEDADVLDLFAGSGALGLEALSRGARHAVFCDRDRQAAQAVRQNIRALGVEAQATLLAMDYRKAVEQLAADARAFHIIFIDPPYEMPVEPVLSLLAERSMLKARGMMILEQGRRSALRLPAALRVERSKQYRDTRIDFISLSQEEPDDDGHLSGQL